MVKVGYDKLALVSMLVGTRLIHALAEHGLGEDGHNSFSLSELVGRADAMLAGKAIRKYWEPFCLNFAERLPPEFKGTRVNYSGGRIHLDWTDQ